MFCDAAFTSIPLFRDLHDKRGIGAVGPINAKKPGKGGDCNSWPHQQFKKGDVNYLKRGWDKTSFTKTASGGWLQAMTWLDNKFVKFLSSSYVTSEKVTVLRCVWYVCVCVCVFGCPHYHTSPSLTVAPTLRWMRCLKKRVPIPTRLVVQMYQKHMGYVDRFDKNCALFR